MKPILKRSSSAFLQFVVVLFGIGALALMLWEPHLEGRNANATVFEIYFKDPFLAYAYLASIPFFVALFHAFKVLGYAGQDRVLSQAAVKSMRTIKFCAVGMIGFVAGALMFILTAEGEDGAGGVAIGVFIAFFSIVLAAIAATFQQVLQNAVDLKSENDLTV
jgi:hypothetical protein